MIMTDYRTLGRSGLVVSPFALGAMTFGATRWGADKATSRDLVHAYLAAGGNFIDTANVYANGASEEFLGELIAGGDLRNDIVLATKAAFSERAGTPLSGGNGAKTVHAALDASLRRLRTDYVDLYWIHIWDMVTPPDDLLETLSGLVRSGKIRHYGLSNMPAWYVARLATLAEAHALPRPIALQYQYSLVERGIEPEILPAARAHGLELVAWSPLAGGFLSGKYASLPEAREAAAAAGDGTARLAGPNPFGDTKFTVRNWTILATIREVAAELGATPTQVALAWLLARGVLVLLGASQPQQLTESFQAFSLQLDGAHAERLHAASKPALGYPAELFTPAIRSRLFGGCSVTSSWA
jgi:aryl-alcohol dehydrogenase-like predicted oxidoreductase